MWCSRCLDARPQGRVRTRAASGACARRAWGRAAFRRFTACGEALDRRIGSLIGRKGPPLSMKAPWSAELTLWRRLRRRSKRTPVASSSAAGCCACCPRTAAPHKSPHTARCHGGSRCLLPYAPVRRPGVVAGTPCRRACTYSIRQPFVYFLGSARLCGTTPAPKAVYPPHTHRRSHATGAHRGRRCRTQSSSTCCQRSSPEVRRAWWHRQSSSSASR